MLESGFEELYNSSLVDPEGCWDRFGKEVAWNKPYTSVLDNKDSPIGNWFVGGEINMSYNCLDKAIEEGYGNDIAIIYKSYAFGITQEITYKSLLKSVELLAGLMVQKCGIKKGNRVLLYFPTIPECLIGMLACTRIGAIYTAVFDGFPVPIISKRILHIEPKLIMTCNVAFDNHVLVNFKEKIDIAIEQSRLIPDFCIIYNRPNTEPANMIKGRDLDWISEVENVSPEGPIPLESNHPMYLIYTSGTTGEPKGFVMVTGNSIVMDKYITKYIIHLNVRECMWSYSGFGWITGQTIQSYGPLLCRCTTVLYEDSPDFNQICKFLNSNKIVSIFCIPTIMRMLRNDYKHSDMKISQNALRTIYLAGEVSDKNLQQWTSKCFKSPVYTMWGQTELNGFVSSPCLGFGRPVNSSPVLTMGVQPKIVDSETGKECPRETIGRIVLKTPITPALASTIYKDHERYLQTYFSKYPGYYDTMDYGRLMKDESLEVIGRADDALNVYSTILSPGEIEEICLKSEDTINAAAVPLNDLITGQVPFVFIIKRNDHKNSDAEIISNIITMLLTNIGDWIPFHNVVIVPDFPITITGKISRNSLAAMINEREYKIPPTVRNPQVYQVIYDIVTKLGYKATLPTDL